MIDKNIKAYIVKNIISIADDYNLCIKYDKDASFKEINRNKKCYVIGFKLTSAILPYDEMIFRIKKINNNINIPKMSLIKHFENKIIVLYIKFNDIPTIERYIKIKNLINE